MLDDLDNYRAIYIDLLTYFDYATEKERRTSGYATWFTAGGAIHIAHYDVIDDVITGKL